jgi:hypothetical protein
MKRPFELRHFTNMILLVILLLLVWTIGTELGWGNRINPPLPQPTPQKNHPAVLPLQPDFILQPLNLSYTTILERPLFTPGRHSLPTTSTSHQHKTSTVATRHSPPPPPPLPLPVEPPMPTMRKGQFILDGIIISKDKNIALLREVITRKVIRVELGQEINGMQVEKLDRNKLTFKQGDEREELVLTIKTGPNQPGKPVGPVGVPTQLTTPAVPPPDSPVTTPAEKVTDPRSIFELRRSMRQQPPE